MHCNRLVRIYYYNLMIYWLKMHVYQTTYKQLRALSYLVLGAFTVVDTVAVLLCLWFTK